MVAAIALAGASAGDAWSQALPLPPGQIIVGDVARGQSFPSAPTNWQGTSVSSITDGSDANIYMLPLVSPSTLPFVDSTSSPAAVVLTTAPTQYVRFYAPPNTTQAGSFVVGSNVVRGLTPAQIKDVLALPYLPTMETLVEVPAGACILIGTAGPILNSLVTPLGLWGHGGGMQEYLIGKQRNGAGCGLAAQTPSTFPVYTGNFINGQPIGAQALLYGPRAGGGNAGAVAGALDRGPYPALYTPMDGMYNSLDVLNFGDPAPLRAALVQLDGEIHASVQTVMLGDSLYLREAVLGRMHQASFTTGVGPMAALEAGGPTLAYADESASSSAQTAADAALAYAGNRAPAFPVKAAPPSVPGPETVFWAQGVGAWGQLAGDGNAAGVNRDLAGFFIGVDRHFAPNWLAGIAAGYTNSSLSIAEPASSADINTAHFAGYAAADFGPWDLRGAAAASFSMLNTSRDIIFPGFFDTESAQYLAVTAQVFGEVGYRIAFGQIATEPFAGLAFAYLNTGRFGESGSSGAAALSSSGNSDDIGYSTLGARAAINYVLANGMVLTPHGSAAWQHAIGTVTPTAALAFVTNGAPFTASGVPLARDAALIQAGFDLQLNQRIALGLFYFGELGGGVQDNSVRGNLSWRF